MDLSVCQDTQGPWSSRDWGGPEVDRTLHWWPWHLLCFLIPQRRKTTARRNTERNKQYLRRALSAKGGVNSENLFSFFMIIRHFIRETWHCPHRTPLCSHLEMLQENQVVWVAIIHSIHPSSGMQEVYFRQRSSHTPFLAIINPIIPIPHFSFHLPSPSFYPHLSFSWLCQHEIIKLPLANLGKNMAWILLLEQKTILCFHCCFAVLSIAPYWVNGRCINCTILKSKYNRIHKGKDILYCSVISKVFILDQNISEPKTEHIWNSFSENQLVEKWILYSWRN